MLKFSLKSLLEWEELDPENHLKLTTKPGKHRNVTIRFNVTHPVQVWASENEDFEDPTLIAAAGGLFTVEFTINRPMWIGATAVQQLEHVDPETGEITNITPTVYYETQARPQIMKKQAEYAFTRPMTADILARQQKLKEMDMAKATSEFNERRRSEALEKERQRVFELQMADMRKLAEGLTTAQQTPPKTTTPETTTTEPKTENKNVQTETPE